MSGIVYAYAGYPALLKILSIFHKKPPVKGSLTPYVTMIISAYNEENVIAGKIENTLALDYPKDFLEIMVVSDASTDRTEEIAGAYSDRGIRVLRIEGRVGKTSCLNIAVPRAKGEIIVFSDANSEYNPGALKAITSNFTDPEVGCVTGYTRYSTSRDSDVSEPVGLYSRLEKITKQLESETGSCVGADGAVFAIRSFLWRPLKVTDINDFVIPLNVVRQGYRVVLEDGSWCAEETARDTSGEFNRQVRITNRTLRAIFTNADLMNPLKTGFFSFKLISHKLFKFMTPLFMFAAAVSNLLLFKKGPLFRLALILQALFYASALPAPADNPQKLFKIAGTLRTFIIVNLAIARAWFTYLKGENFTTWKTTR